MNSRTRGLVLQLLLLVLAGCGTAKEPVVRVQGRVTFQGQPVTNALVIFQKEDSAEAVFAELNAEGGFQIATHNRAGLPAGRYRVAVKPVPGADSPPPLAGMEKDAPPPRPHPHIPAKFHTVESSGLTITVAMGSAGPLELDLGR
jgi:hypothetical protein